MSRSPSSPGAGRRSSGTGRGLTGRGSAIVLLTVALVAVLVAGCSSVLGPRVTVINDTDGAFTIEADGAWVGTVGPRARATLPFPLGDGTTEVWAKNDVGQILVSIGGTRAMWDNALEGTIPMSGWQTFDCGRILIASEPFDESVPGPFQNPCP